MRLHHSLAALAMVTIACCGCGGKYSTHSVKGQVALEDGVPLDDVQITFQCDDPAITATAVTDAQGYYALGTVEEGDGAPAGTYRVAIVEMEDLSNPDAVRPPRIANRYASLQGSGLTITVPSPEGYDLKLAGPER